MVLARVEEPFDHPEWIFEAKLDGFRALAYIQGGRCEVVSRKNHVYKSFSRLCSDIAAGLKIEDAILDGEIVCLGADGLPIFNQLLYHRGTPYFYAFDMLWLNGSDWRGAALIERKDALQRIIPSQPFPVIYNSHQDGEGKALFEAACRIDLKASWPSGDTAPIPRTSIERAG
jgi:bifunctional non-homologous end joining protein LigD